MRYAHNLFFYNILLFLLIGCKSRVEQKEAVYNLPVQAEQGIHAVIEIPAGTNRKIEFNPERKRFETDTLDGAERIINFLPYPGNYGFIPSTLMDETQGGDGDALDILVICESVKTGTVLEVIPIAALLLRDQGELDTKIIAVPVDSGLRTIQATTFEDWLIDYSAAKYIVEQWFLSYKGLGQTEFIGWQDAGKAREEIEKWSVE